MGAPKTDEAGIRQVIRALVASGHTPFAVNDGEETIHVKNETEAIEAITAVDCAHLYVQLPDGKTNGWVFFVLGNDPEEVVCDYTTNLDPTVEALTAKWWF
jgi:hypothetical protein